MTFVIILLVVIAGIFALGAVAARRRRIVGSPADRWKAEHAAADALNRAHERSGAADGGGGSVG